MHFGGSFLFYPILSCLHSSFFQQKLSSLAPDNSNKISYSTPVALKPTPPAINSATLSVQPATSDEALSSSPNTRSTIPKTGKQLFLHAVYTFLTDLSDILTSIRISKLCIRLVFHLYTKHKMIVLTFL